MGLVDFILDKTIDGLDRLLGGTPSINNFSLSTMLTDTHAIKVSDELASVKESIRENTAKIEEEIINYINKSIEELITLLEQVNKEKYGGSCLNINISKLKEENELLKNEVVGFIGNVMDERLVPTDPELSIILEELDDKKRKEKFDEFCDKVQREAINKLSKKIEATVKKQEKVVSKEVRSRLAEMDEKMKRSTDIYQQIISQKEKDEAKLVNTRIKNIYQHGLFTILIDQLEV